VLGSADDAGHLGLVLDDVDLTNEFERFLGLDVLTLLEQLAPCMSKTASSRASAGLGDDVVPGVLVDDEAPL